MQNSTRRLQFSTDASEPVDRLRLDGKAARMALSTSPMIWQAELMNPANRYHGHRFPPEIISTAVSLYNRFSLSFRDVEDLLGHCHFDG